MSIEAFVMNYRDGEPVPLPFDAVRRIFDTPGTQWNDEHNYLNVRFADPADYVDIFCDADAPLTNVTKGLMIARPIAHPDYLERTFRVLQLDNVMLFYTDDTTPIFHASSDPSQYPQELLDELGTPRIALSPDDLLHHT